MDSLDRFLTVKQQALSSHRPCYPVPQLMSKEDERRVQGAREEFAKSI